jgi:hypothetical protein
MSIENVAEIMDELMDKNLKDCLSSEKKNFLTELLQNIIIVFGLETSIEAFNFPLYDWYNGNILNKIVLMVFQPSLFCKSNDHCEHYLSENQINNALRACYDLITKYNCKHNYEDYYGSTIFGYFNKDISKLKLPSLLIKYIPAFRFIFRYGPNAINIQQMFIRHWYKKHLDKKRKAVQIIEKQWLEVMLCPYHNIGKRVIEKYKKHFYILASNQ